MPTHLLQTPHISALPSSLPPIPSCSTLQTPLPRPRPCPFPPPSSNNPPPSHSPPPPASAHKTIPSHTHWEGHAPDPCMQPNIHRTPEATTPAALSRRRPGSEPPHALPSPRRRPHPRARVDPQPNILPHPQPQAPTCPSPSPTPASPALS